MTNFYNIGVFLEVVEDAEFNSGTFRHQHGNCITILDTFRQVFDSFPMKFKVIFMVNTINSHFRITRAPTLLM